MMHVEGARRLTAVDEIAASHGVRPGHTAADATALFGGLKILDADPEEDLRALTRIADWCTRFSPAIAIDAPDGLFLDIEGCAHLWGDEADLMDALLARLRRQDIPAQAAIADTFAAAWALARYGDENRRIATGDAAPRLGHLPIAALRIDAGATARISRLGVRTIDQLSALPRAALRKRFGEAILERMDHALGRAREAIVFRQTPSPWRERAVFASGLMTAESLAATVGDLSTRLCARLEARALGARRFEARFHRVDGDTARCGVRMALPASDPARLAKLLAPKIETIDPGFGIEVVTVHAGAVAPLRTIQADFAAPADETAQADLAPLVDRLVNRLGEGRLWRIAPRQSHLPERAVVHAPPLSAPTDAHLEKQRPVRLFAPEAIEVVAALPDAPPRLFRWRGRTHVILNAEGPERIAAEWWRQPWDKVRIDDVRDYYRVEDRDGARFWLFRAGLYGGATAPQWWMHGLFA